MSTIPTLSTFAASLAAATTLLLPPTLPAQDERQPQPEVAPGAVVVERGDDRIVIEWHGGKPRVTVNGRRLDREHRDGLLSYRVEDLSVHARDMTLPTLTPGTYLTTPQPSTSGPEALRHLFQWSVGRDDGPEPHIGVQVGAVPAPLAEHLGLDADACVLVLGVTDGGPAAAAGLAENDIVTGVDDADEVTDTTLREAVARTAPGDSLRMRIVRRGKPQELTVVVGELEAPKQWTSLWPGTGFDAQYRLPKEGEWSTVMHPLQMQWRRDQPQVAEELAEIRKRLDEIRALLDK